MNIKIRTQKYDVLDNGLIFIPVDENQVIFQMKLSNAFEFEVVLQFEDNVEKEQSIEKSVDGNTIKYICTNFKNSGTGVTYPLELATFDNKKVYFQFWHYQMSMDSPKKIEYVFYQER